MCVCTCFGRVQITVFSGSLYPLPLALWFYVMAGHPDAMCLLLTLLIHHITVLPQTGSSSQIAHQDHWHSDSCFLSSETQLLAPPSHLIHYVLQNFISAVTFSVAPLS